VPRTFSLKEADNTPPDTVSGQPDELLSSKKAEPISDKVVVEEHLKDWILRSVETQQELDLEALQESTNVEYAR
jgi:hypothetical protein